MEVFSSYIYVSGFSSISAVHWGIFNMYWTFLSDSCMKISSDKEFLINVRVRLCRVKI